MNKFNLLIVEDGEDFCLGTDVTSIELEDNELRYIYDNNERGGVFRLDKVDSVIVKINR